MPSLILAIARTTFIESVRQPVFFILVMLSGLFQLVNTASTGFALSYTESSEVSGDDKLLLDVGLATVLFCGTLLAAFIATAAVSREIENRTVLTIVSKPVPRAAVVLGKYVGIAGALLVGGVAMIMFLEMGIRHGVLSTAKDEIDQPVMTYSLAAVGLSMLAGLWGNFFYGWHFTQTATLLLSPLLTLAWVLVLLTKKDWGWQPLGTDFKPQITTAAACVVLALLVLSAVATAASTRLGQVMTVVVCFGAFVLGLLSNHVFGRHAFQNDLIGQVINAEPLDARSESFEGSGDTYAVTLKTAPTRLVAPGSPLYWGPNPNGFDLLVPAFEPYRGRVGDSNAYFAKSTPPAIVVTEVKDRTLTIRNIGATPLAVGRPPRADDFVFMTPTRVGRLALAAWAVVPNMQFYWLTDAVTQNRPVPIRHLGILLVYSLAQVVGFLGLAVVFFQRREVG